MTEKLEVNAEAARRVGLADSIVVPNPRADQAHEAFDYLRLRAQQRSDRGTTGLLLVGPSQTGKSTILHTYRQRQNTPDALDAGRIPVLMVTLTANQTRKGLAQDILRAIDQFGYQTLWKTGTEGVLLSRVQAIIKERGIELLMLDEFQHLIHSDSNKVVGSVSDTIKWLLMESVVPVVMSGVEEAWQPIKANAQLQNRCPGPIVLQPLRFENDTDRRLFETFLYSYLTEIEDRGLIDDAVSVMAEPSIPICLFEASEGVLGQVCNLIKDALYIALRRGGTALTSPDLAEATDRSWVMFDRSRVNPFIHGPAAVRPARRLGR